MDYYRQAANANEKKLGGFGSFSVRYKPYRLGRNLKTGASAIISARQVVTFHPSNPLKDTVEITKSLPDSGPLMVRERLVLPMPLDSGKG